MVGEEELCMSAELNPSSNPAQVFLGYSFFPVRSEAWSVGTASIFFRIFTSGHMYLSKGSSVPEGQKLNE